MKPVVLFVAFRPFDLRLIVDSGVIQHLVDDVSVILVGPPALQETFTAMLGGKVRFECLRYQTSKVQGMNDLAEARPGMKAFLRGQIDQCLRLVYGCPRGTEENRTGILHRRTFREDLAGQLLPNRLVGHAVLATARLANRSRFLRRTLQRCYALLADFEDHRDLLEELAPDLVVLPSAGLSIDGWFMAEAQKAGIPVAVLSQSWDRTSSKGYPTLPPDYVVVWSEAMQDEVVRYWDLPAERIFVEGAPPWDVHFKAEVTESREAFMGARGLDPEAKTVYAALTGPAWHENNKKLVDILLELRRDLPELHGINLLVRVHPNYLSKAFSSEYEDLMGHLRGLPDAAAVYIDVPDVKSMDNTFIVGERYDSELHALLTHADVMVSIPSSQMIEAAIFDLPYVELNYGRWKNQVLDVEFSDRVLEHFVRLRRPKAGPLCSRPEDIGPLLVEELTHPEGRRAARAALVEQEVGANRGCATEATAERIRLLACARHREKRQVPATP